MKQTLVNVGRIIIGNSWVNSWTISWLGKCLSNKTSPKYWWRSSKKYLKVMCFTNPILGTFARLCESMPAMVNTWYMMVYDISGMVVHPITRILMLAIPIPINSALALIKLFKMAHIKIDNNNTLSRR